MKAIYRGYEIRATRERSLGGPMLLYYSILRLSDGYLGEESFTDAAETVPDIVAQLKDRIDAELSEDDPWMEREGLKP